MYKNAKSFAKYDQRKYPYSVYLRNSKFSFMFEIIK